jgi:hypothetical protein
MSDLPEDFQRLLPKQAAPEEPDDRDDYLWVFDPETTEVHIEAEKPDHPAHYPTHGEMAKHVTHPDRVQGYVWAIKGGWRITDEFNKKIDDPFLLKRIREALRSQHPAPALPHIRYHGQP